MIITIFTCLIKTFFYMRVVKEFSFIVTMLVNVIKDLIVFMVFFSILVLMFSLVFDVVSVNHAKEYSHITPFLGNIFTTLRLALGDFDFRVLEPLENEQFALNQRQHIIFWSMWLIMVIFSSMIFLNFIIAEVSNSYRKVKVNI